MIEYRIQKENEQGGQFKSQEVTLIKTNNKAKQV